MFEKAFFAGVVFENVEVILVGLLEGEEVLGVDNKGVLAGVFDNRNVAVSFGDVENG